MSPSRGRLLLPILAALLAGCSSGGRPASPTGAGGSDGTASSPVVLLEDFSARQVFPPNNWWNLDISAAPVDASSQAYIDWISGRTASRSPASDVCSRNA